MKSYFSVAAILFVALPILALVPGCGGGTPPLSTPTATPQPTTTATAQTTPTRTSTPAPTATAAHDGANLSIFSSNKANFGVSSVVTSTLTITGNTKDFNIDVPVTGGRHVGFDAARFEDSDIPSGPIKAGETYDISFGDGGTFTFGAYYDQHYWHSDGLHGSVVVQSVRGKQVTLQVKNVVLPAEETNNNQAIGTLTVNGTIIATIPSA